jgi:tellurite methyltransferase
MSESDREKWNRKHAANAQDCPPPPDWLARHFALLPCGTALDVATGRGAVAIELARLGWQVTAVDISDVAIRLAADAARVKGLDIRWITADLDAFDLPPSRFDLITVFYFLDRFRLPKQVIAALRPGGALLYETFTVDQLRIPSNHLKNPAHMLRPAELLDLFRPLRVRAYRETAMPDRAVASLLAEKKI